MNSASKAWMLGPKAENYDFFEKMLLEATRDYCFWRRNFHPEDSPHVTANLQTDSDFQLFQQRLHDALFRLLSRLKGSVPFFSPRYLGHMLSDISLPATLGYIAAMLYNQNNVYEELAPVTLHFEEEAMKKIAAMIGYRTTRVTPDSSKAWGHLCSGGSAAILEALWVARDLRMLPYQVALTIGSLSHSDLTNAQTLKADLESLPVHGRAFGDLLKENMPLWHIPIREIIALGRQLYDLCRNDSTLATIVQQHSVGNLGLARLSEECKSRLPRVSPKEYKIILSLNAHFAVRKSAGIIGLGESNLVRIPLDRSHLRMDIPSLERAISTCHSRNECVLAVVGLYGSTEVGAIDDFDSIAAIRDARSTGTSTGDFWIHADACYGGYAASLTHPGADVSTLQDFLTGLSPPGEAPAVSVPTTQWVERWLRTTAALRECDSLSIDPHKLGYVPYPAGAVLYKDEYAPEFIRCDSPYLNAPSASAWFTLTDDYLQKLRKADVPAPVLLKLQPWVRKRFPTKTHFVDALTQLLTSEEIAEHQPSLLTHAQSDSWFRPNIGIYTLEASRPGACAAAVWLAHETIPLDRNGHGLMVGESVVGARKLQAALKAELPFPLPQGNDDAIGCAFLCEEPDLNIICYTFPARLGGSRVPLCVMNRAITKLYERFLAINEKTGRDFILAKTSLDFKQYNGNLIGPTHDDTSLASVWQSVNADNKEGGRPTEERSIGKDGTGNPWRDDARIVMARTVVMGPMLLAASTGQVDLAQRYASTLREELSAIMWETLDSPLPEDRRPTLPGYALVVEDVETVREMLCAQLATSFRCLNLPLRAGNVQGARSALDDKEVRCALVDLVLEDDQSGGIKVIEELATHSNFKGALVFTERETRRPEIMSLQTRFPKHRLEFCSKPRMGEQHFQLKMNRVMETLWQILQNP